MFAFKGSSVFENLDHSKLLYLLNMAHISCPTLLCSLYHWYSTQKLTIKWCNDFCSYFSVSNSIKQGGILRPPFQCVDGLLICKSQTLLIGCLHGDTLINHFMYADDLYILWSQCCCFEKTYRMLYQVGYKITYNINKSYCTVINRKSQEMTSIHCVNLNNRPLPYTMTCKYLGHIINNNLTDDDDIARQKRYLYAQSNVSARTICVCSPSTEITIF